MVRSVFVADKLDAMWTVSADLGKVSALNVEHNMSVFNQISTQCTLLLHLLIIPTAHYSSGSLPTSRLWFVVTHCQPKSAHFAPVAESPQTLCKCAVCSNPPWATIAVTHRPRTGSAASWLQSVPAPHQGDHQEPHQTTITRETTIENKESTSTERHHHKEYTVNRDSLLKHHQISLTLVAHFAPVIR